MIFWMVSSRSETVIFYIWDSVQELMRPWSRTWVVVKGTHARLRSMITWHHVCPLILPSINLILHPVLMTSPRGFFGFHRLPFVNRRESCDRSCRRFCMSRSFLSVDHDRTTIVLITGAEVEGLGSFEDILPSSGLIRFTHTIFFNFFFLYCEFINFLKSCLLWRTPPTACTITLHVHCRMIVHCNCSLFCRIFIISAP